MLLATAFIVMDADERPRQAARASEVFLTALPARSAGGLVQDLGGRYGSYWPPRRLAVAANPFGRPMVYPEAAFERFQGLVEGATAGADSDGGDDGAPCTDGGSFERFFSAAMVWGVVLEAD